VDCTVPHTGQTVFVGEWTSDVSPSDASKLPAGSPAEKQLLASLKLQFAKCNAAAGALLGTKMKGYFIASRIITNTTGPNDTEWAAGDRWLRCGIVAKRTHSKMLALPDPESLINIMRNVPITRNEFAACWGSGSQGAGLLVDCRSKAARYLLLAVYPGTSFKWPGSKDAMTSKVSKTCEKNPLYRSSGTLRGSWFSLGGAFTKSGIQDMYFYCAIPVSYWVAPQIVDLN
jgi:hypothetical protein